MTTTRLITLPRANYRSQGHLYIDLANALIAYATKRGIRGVPITVAMVESAVETDAKYSNALYERGQDMIADMIATIARRLPPGEDLTLNELDKNGAVTVSLEKGDE